ncbi:MAG: hypothetical protein A2X51_05740 [Candidatus Rokubacteria bacterium GWC2_70_24]|nr:MAG: hypothetical protein A2X53_07920 [Candidatus Rokubacteria bacterium GWA2_70_23]OGK86872.1 MAG: hypothetical protein A2X51_05740 [Candidatus Rokubacteria bacterium GWC2_70_24]
MTEPLHKLCVAVPEAEWTLVEERGDETVMGAEVVFTLAWRILTHAGRLVLRISEEAESVVGLVAARTRLAGLRPRIASG